MSDDTFLIKDLLAIASPFIKATVDTFVTPKLERLKTSYDFGTKKYKIPTVENFTEYFHRTYKRLSLVNTLVFNNSQKYLKEIYIPLTIKRKSDNTKGIKIDSYPIRTIKKFQKILITDTAGMGKSTLMKRIFIDIIDTHAAIPIFIELRRLSKDKTLIEEIFEQLNSINSEFDKALMNEFISDGEFVFILDGYDEIPIIDKEAVTEDIQKFISKSTENYFFLTSRPESALKSFGDFIEFSIEPLKKKEAFELLRKYDIKGNVSKSLIKKLEEPNQRNIEEFLTNPLLVSLLFTAFEYKQIIPFKKHLFYRQVYDANFETHDLTKGDSYMHKKHSLLDIDNFHSVLRHIGYECLKLQKIEFDRDELLVLVNNAKKFCVGIDFVSSDFIRDLISTVPLFSQDGIYYKWSHKSLQEYFASQFIYLDSKGKQEVILSRIYYSPNLDNYINLLDIYYDIDYKSFRNVIIKKIDL